MGKPGISVITSVIFIPIGQSLPTGIRLRVGVNTMSLSPDQIKKLEEFEEWFDRWPYSAYEDIEHRELVKKLREIFTRTSSTYSKGRKP